jgi:Domain of unknown function (DUF4410)
MLLPREAT